MGFLRNDSLKTRKTAVFVDGRRWMAKNKDLLGEDYSIDAVSVE